MIDEPVRKPWIKRKSLWAGLTMILSGLGGFFTGSMDPWMAWLMVNNGAATIFVRQAVEEAPIRARGLDGHQQ